MIADIFNKPVTVQNNSDTIGLGAFLLTATEMGLYNTLEEATQPINISGIYTPNKQDHEVYMRYFKIFERLSYKLAEDFEEIANLQMNG
jgi:gluconokinase